MTRDSQGVMYGSRLAAPGARQLALHGRDPAARATKGTESTRTTGMPESGARSRPCPVCLEERRLVLTEYKAFHPAAGACRDSGLEQPEVLD